ncbi:MAG: radical SAM/SPASM domain-containing protein [Kiritimatiellae bacterium]|jgi:MoaA/NifB/PqqE/SkfB family radical SAM enzyme|nr:radical SAM/SPASM domain-containing protein [Kiritimatiellia bacterium]MDD3440516.1 radical SAM/SPASM domain-containing protein [Kiritimatiellia bacterium]MDD4117298.1 radical SAM/SPASM domain-containing protein [Kiritimatiellia bacterium]NCC91799.1 radical SAM protein [Opitutae bacterium]
MDLSIILTYRCNSRCSMCNIWQHPTLPAEEVTLETLAKLPGGFDYLNLTGGEPTLRADLEALVDLLHPKTRQLEISTNGLQADKLERILRKHPDVKIRISLEGIGERNNAIRGEKNGFERKMDTMKRLVAAGGCDLGFATTFQDDNCDQLLDLYRLCNSFGGEMATSALHNGYQFHKTDNEPYNRVRIARAVQPLIVEMLRSRRPKNWFRAYLNLGLMKKILGQPRLIPCTAGRDFAFVDPWGSVYACNVRPDLEIGDLTSQTWEEIYHGPRAVEARTKVARCTHNCWMVGSAKTAIRNKHFAKLPRLKPLAWVLVNKLRVALGRPVPFDRYVDFRDVADSPVVPKRDTWLGKVFRPAFQSKREKPYGAFNNVMNK